MKKFIFLLAGIISFSCNMEKEIDLDLPDYESKIVVECYLLPGSDFRLALFESVSYFDTPQLPTVDSALVIIRYNGNTDTLEYIGLSFAGKYFNYRSSTIVPADYTSLFTLEIIDKRGRRLTASTTIPILVPIDTITIETNADSLSFPLTRFTDDPSTEDLYRYQVEENNIGREVTDFQFDDKLFETSQVAIGSNYSLKKADQVTVSLFHLTKEHFDFLESVNAAIDANGNPFGQPAVIKSNINGGLGIFTGVAVDQKTFLIP